MNVLVMVNDERGNCIWSTVVDDYVSEEMVEGEVARWLISDAKEKSNKNVDEDTLKWVRDWADEMVTTEGLTRQWRRAYAQLSIAADYVVALIDRSEVKKEDDDG